MRAAPLALVLVLAACGDRTLPAADGGRADGQMTNDGRARPDVWGTDGDCLRPPGGCYNSQDCPTGQECMGCFADPCCPMCAVCYGHCVSDAQCWANKDCAQDEYCEFGGEDCGKTTPGRCTPRPTVCPDGGFSPTCGCDGKTYMSPCDANELGVSVAKNEACNKAQCESINQAYVAALQSAKACCPVCAALQCMDKVESDLACHGCLTHVNDTTKLNALAAQWKGLACDTIPWGPCPGVACPPDGMGVCDGATSTCQDTWSTP